MAINDLVSDALTRVRNAGMRKLATTTLVHSKSVEAVANILVEKGYLESANVIEDGVKKTIKVVLKYDENGNSVINELKRDFVSMYASRNVSKVFLKEILFSIVNVTKSMTMQIFSLLKYVTII